MQRFSDVIVSIYDASLSPAKWPAALSRIGAQFNAEGAVVYFYDDRHKANFMFSTGLEDAVRLYVDERWWERDIHMQRAGALHLTGGDVFSDATVATEEEIETLPIYADFFRRVGFGWLMSCVMLPDLDQFVGLSVPRAKAKGPYSRDEMEMLRLFGSHVEQALRISLRISDLQASETALVQALDAMATCVVALDAEGRRVFANRAGAALFGACFRTLDDGRVAPQMAEEQPRYAALLASAGEAAVQPTAPRTCVLTGADGARIAVWALPVTRSGQGRLGARDVAETLLLAMPIERGHEFDPAVVRDIFGLTAGEARLAALIGGGLSVDAAADRLGVAEGTARVVLKNVFRKLGINRQAELVLRMSTLGAVGARRSDDDKPS